MKKDIAKKYDHISVEKNLYKWWVDRKYFVPNLDDKTQKNYSIVIPPPNVTGKLHLGHAWDTVLQDMMIRYKKLNGFNTLWVPGMDHAGIATQSKVEERLYKEKHLLKHDLGKEKFLKLVWEWKESFAVTIREQWAKLGLGLDYTKEQFTLSPEISDLVSKTFVDLYNESLIYQDYRIISWDPKLKTALSNIEVIYKQVSGKMYHFKYWLEDASDFLVVATTRPETMFADECLVVNSKDLRYQKYIGKTAINPANMKKIPIIADDYVDESFGTGVMKCTPAHDPNDFLIGKKYKLNFPICMNIDGTMNNLAKAYVGLDRFVCRERLVSDLEKTNLVEKIEDHTHNVGFSERSDVVVEPYLSKQWFLNMRPLAQKVIDQQSSKDSVAFFPKRFNDTLITWMNNIEDWCLSRQLWWGHPIPVWYHKETGEIYVNNKAPDDIENYEQDPDVLDTWFSSALWPFAALGFNFSQELYDKFYPTNLLVTGYDIIFFWISRMMFQGLKITGKKPFNDVLIHGLIRDEENRKMSKSLGNGIDPMDVIDKYGADSLRWFLVANTAPGNDLRFSTEKLKTSWNFINKLWNASRYILLNSNAKLEEQFLFADNLEVDSQKLNSVNNWIISRLENVKKDFFILMDKYEFTIVSKMIYNFVWKDFCAQYIEMSKILLNSLDKKIILKTQNTLIYVLKEILKLLHPFMPFVTERLYREMSLKESILLERYSQPKDVLEDTAKIPLLNEIIDSIREFRSKNNYPKKHKLEAFIISDSKNSISSELDVYNQILLGLVNVEVKISENMDKKWSVINFTNFQLFIEFDNSDNIAKELQELKLELKRLEEEIKRSEKLLSNNNFLAKAREAKINIEKEKYNNYLSQKDLIKKRINELE